MKLLSLTAAFFINFIFSFTLFAYEDNQCSPKNREFTERITLNILETPTEAGSPSCNNCSPPVENSRNPIQSFLDYLKSIILPTAKPLDSPPIQSTTEAEPQPSIIPDICFYAGMLRSTALNNSYYQCSSPSAPSRQADSSQQNAPCLTEDYVKMTAQAFNETADCFGFTDKEKQDLFATINHESAYMLNIKSSEGAVCYGQMTSKTFQNLNKFIYARNDKTWESYGSAINQVFNNCDSLKSKVIPQQIATQGESDQDYKKCYSARPCYNCCSSNSEKYCFRKTDKEGIPKYTKCGSHSESVCCRKTGGVENCISCWEKCEKTGDPCLPCSHCSDSLTNQAPMRCSLTSNPYSCFFYSMLNLKLNMIEFDKWYNYHPTYLPNVEVEEEFIEKYGETLQRNQIYIAKGKLIGGNSGNIYEDMVFQHYKEMYNVLPHLGQESIIEEHKPVTLFDPEELRAHFIHTAHNGGRTIVIETFIDFMKKVKSKISAGTSCNQDPVCKKMRDKILSGSPLSLSDLRNEWSIYASDIIQTQNPESKNFNHESKDFMDESDQHLQNILNPEQLSIYLDQKSPENKERIISEIENKCSFLKSK